MATYVIGDVQGCYHELQTLLAACHYHPSHDQLWFAGDLINRGPNSLPCLRFIKQLSEQGSVAIVLGNHDLHFLAVALGNNKPGKKDTFHDILDAPDKMELLLWLKQQPLLHYDHRLQAVMTHAGLYPAWSLEQAIENAREVEHILRGNQLNAFFSHMYGNEPACWKDSLSGWDRIRFITNAFTRMRFCTQTYQLDLKCKVAVGDQPEHLQPWFHLPSKTTNVTIIFGHWAALEGQTGCPNIIATDTGCVWGGKLTAYCIETGQVFQVPALANPFSLKE